MNLRDHLEAIKKRAGELTPEIFLEESRPANSPTHHYFDWDVQRNAERWLVEQAHKLIQQVQVTYKKTDGTTSRVRAYHAVRRDDNRYVYESLEDLQQDPTSREIVLREMQRDWEQLRARYQNLEEFWELVEAERPKAKVSQTKTKPKAKTGEVAAPPLRALRPGTASR